MQTVVALSMVSKFFTFKMHQSMEHVKTYFTVEGLIIPWMHETGCIGTYRLCSISAVNPKRDV